MRRRDKRGSVVVTPRVRSTRCTGAELPAPYRCRRESRTLAESGTSKEDLRRKGRTGWRSAPDGWHSAPRRPRLRHIGCRTVHRLLRSSPHRCRRSNRRPSPHRHRSRTSERHRRRPNHSCRQRPRGDWRRRMASRTHRHRYSRLSRCWRLRCRCLPPGWSRRHGYGHRNR
jgi:hypothetical protein